MSQLLIADKAPRMTSREIAELVGKRHDNVKRTVETLAQAGVIEFPQSEEIPTATKPVAVYVFSGERGRRDSIVVVAQLCPEFTARLVDRWQELESRQAVTVPQSYAAALLEAGRLALLAEEQAEQLAIAAPKVEFVDRYVDTAGSMSFRQVAKLLKANERVLRQLLLDGHVMYRLNGALTPYQNHIDAGRFEVKTGTSERNSHAFAQARFTPKGVEWIAGLWAAYQRRAAA